MKSYIYTLFFASICFISCQEEINEDFLHEQLQQSLRDASNGKGASYFTLPSENDFSKIPQDPKNPLSIEKVELGKLLFHETSFSTDGEFPITVGTYSCASCHHAGAGFQSGLAQGLGEGGEGFGLMGESRSRNTLCAPELCDVQPLRSPTILNGAYQPLMLWNGQFGATSLNRGTEDLWTPETPKAINNLGFEGLETQAIAGLEVHRIAFSEEAVLENGYKDLFDSAFPNIDKEERYTLTTAGLALAAFERTVTAYEAPFQKYLRGNKYALSDYQKEGAILFLGKANCVSCHTGPALNKMEFHALGMNEFDPAMVTHIKEDDPAQFGRGMFTGLESDKYKFKTPQLYNQKGIEFLGHGASFNSIKEIIEYKNNAVAENPNVPSSQLAEGFTPLGLTDDEISKIEAFIKFSLHDPNLDRFVPSSTISGNCFPNNDEVSQSDLGCN